MSATDDQIILKWAEQVAVTVTRLDWSDESLRGAAEGNTVQQRFAYLDRCQGRGEQVDADSYHADVQDANRALINYLRHRCTNYDSLLAELETWELTYEGEWDDSGEPVELGEYWAEIQAFGDEKDLAYATIRRRVHAALSQAYPQFANILAPVA